MMTTPPAPYTLDPLSTRSIVIYRAPLKSPRRFRRFARIFVTPTMITAEGPSGYVRRCPDIEAAVSWLADFVA